MDARTTYDLIILGSGAGGGTLLHELAPTGKRILVIERGGYLPREKDNWDSFAVFRDNKYKAEETWLDRDGRPFKPEIHYYVGGNTKLYGSALLRFHERDFGELRHVDGISPAWPIDYRDLAPYYARAEALYAVHGRRGADPTEPEGLPPYPHPPVSHEPRIAELDEDLRRAGLHPFPLPIGIMLDEARPERSPCIRCDSCDGYPCMIHAKAETEVCCVRPALQHPNVTLLTHAKALAVLTSPSGRAATGVLVEREGRQEEYRADVLVVACGAINSAALLLRSRSAAHPNGLANGSDLVGRHYMCHNNSAFVSISNRRNPTRFQKTLALNDWYLGADDFGFPLGHVQTMGKADAAKFGVAAPFPLPQLPLRQMAAHSLDLWLTSEDLPRRENRVALAADGTIRLEYVPNNLEAHDRLNAKLKRTLRLADRARSRASFTLSLRKKIPIHGTTHQCGTLRFGTDPATSVLDVNCRAHEVDNLYVVDSSFFPSSAAMNPALTIFANAIRVADHLRERLG
jgi:choline dehydrogenase-like flavoprotein